MTNTEQHTEQQIKKVLNPHTNISSSSQSGNYERLGNIRKCPSCGAILGSFQMICPECGFEFVGVGPNKFVKEFSDKLNEAVSSASSQISMSVFQHMLDTTGHEEEKRKETAVAVAESQFVKNYPLPLTKEDCIEMLNYMIPKIKPSGATRATKTWRAKYNSILMRLERQCQGDSETQLLVLDFKEQAHISFFGKFHIWWMTLSRYAKIFIYLAMFYAIFGIVMSIVFTKI